MAYLIDETYITVDIDIPNLNEPNSGSLIQLNQFIDTKSRLLLAKALGYPLFKDFDSFIDDGFLPDVPDDPIPDPVPLKWRNLVSGTEYTKDGKVYHWKGLTYTEGDTKQSLIAYFVSSFILKNNVSQVAGIGEIYAEAKNAVNVNPTQRWVSRWNEFVTMYQGSKRNHHYRNPFYWDRFYDSDLNCNFSNDLEVSLIKFLEDNKQDYPNAQLYCWEIENQLGL